MVITKLSPYLSDNMHNERSGKKKIKAIAVLVHLHNQPCPDRIVTMRVFAIRCNVNDGAASLMEQKMYLGGWCQHVKMAF